MSTEEPSRASADSAAQSTGEAAEEAMEQKTIAGLELVVFDMAGTTVYDGDAVNDSLRSALKEFGVSVSRDAVNEVMGIAKPVAIRSLLEAKQRSSGVAPSDENTEAIYQRFLLAMLEYYRSSPLVREVEGASDIFRRLRAAGIKVTLDTGFSRAIADTILERLGWLRDGLLDATVTADEAPGRPHPDMILYLMRAVGVSDTARVAKVGDTPSDLQQGTAAGCGRVIGVTQGSHTYEELVPHPHTYLIDTVADLGDLWGI